MEHRTPPIGTAEYEQLNAQLASYIHALRPDRRYFAGRTFFSLLLKEQGVEAVVNFLDQAQKSLLKDGELEVADFEDNEALEDIFRRSRTKLLTRRAAMGVIAEGLGGAALAGYGAAGVVDQVRHLNSAPPAPQQPEPYAKMLDHTVMPYAYIAIGGSMMDAAYRHNLEYKLGDIANAVTRLSERLPAPTHADALAAGEPASRTR
ncbi:MAG: hypothetical protein DI582_03780 [Azospirillum brasilense]|nr:MAG: hypothetical protein DI582_03780 [Azospirillum brasilense]